MEVEGVELEPDLTYSEYPIRVLDQKDQVTRRRTIKVLQDYLLENFPEFLASI